MKIILSNKARNKLALGLCILWMAVIFIFSSYHATDSSQQSGGLVSLIVDFFGGEMSTLGMNAFEVILRKLAHVSEFAVLGILWYSYFYTSPQGVPKPQKPAFIVSVLYAVSDEVHQYFVPGRAARWYDVTFDTLGVALGILIAVYVIRRYKQWKQG